MGQEIQKSGYNKFNKFRYHELEDLIPPITRECFDQELVLVFDFTDSEAILRVTNWNDKNDFVQYTVPMPEITTLNKGMNIMQSEGSYITYLKKYLLVNAFLIMEKSTVELIAPEGKDDSIVEKSTVSREEPSCEIEVPKCIGKALQRIAAKGIEINRKTVYAHVNWKGISEDEKLAAQNYINNMEASK